MNFKLFYRNIDRKLIWQVLTIKFLVILWGGIVHQVFTRHRFANLGDWLAIWNLWDAPRYLNLAEFGYQSSGENQVNIAFYPLYPLLIRCIETITNNYIVSAFLISALASIATAIFLQNLVAVDYSPKIARSSVLFLFIFPTSYFLHIGYTESLFLALSIGCLLAARTNNWRWVGFLGGLATMTRINGMILIPALIVEAIHQYRINKRFNRSWLWILAVPSGLIIYLLCNLWVNGNIFSFLEFQREFWHKSSAFPWQSIWAKIQQTPRYAAYEMQMVGVQELLFIAIGLAGTIWSWFKLRPVYSVWMTGNWWLFTSTSFILSVPRYTLVLFPLYIGFSFLYKERILYNVIIVWCVVFLLLFSGLFAVGKWAF
ncbi:mannosyltransferase family protein [Merismopedia glauca]|uniref:mannosyltransferase family protein n=1 Tax=Merismopedia glauca TaxID=292586 RepID=UPI0015E7D149|nr:mannosyltransferase family protein [Merismopedia glauca]